MRISVRAIDKNPTRSRLNRPSIGRGVLRCIINIQCIRCTHSRCWISDCSACTRCVMHDNIHRFDRSITKTTDCQCDSISTRRRESMAWIQLRRCIGCARRRVAKVPSEFSSWCVQWASCIRKRYIRIVNTHIFGCEEVSNRAEIGISISRCGVTQTVRIAVLRCQFYFINITPTGLRAHIANRSLINVNRRRIILQSIHF